MREKMKKMLFLMLFLIILGAANVNSQVRIGGNGQPNGAAVLDLNATDATINGTKTLALPRVSLSSTTDQLGYSTLLNGMLVYNTTATPGAGVYYWDGSKWAKVSDGSFVEGDAIVGNEIADTIAGGGLTRSGSGTPGSPYKVGIKPNGIVNSMIADKAVSLSKISTTAADSGLFFLADGTGVRPSGFFTKEYRDTTLLAPWKYQPVSWYTVLDTSVTITFKRNSWTSIPAPGVSAYDVCHGVYPNGLVTLFTSYNYILAMTAHSTDAGIAVLVRCYRPQ
ncbi:hypothetical protein FACS189451_07490 [Bacteroidia bacterium]|nr:hypothetical protein FACS189451_07490 [Bacteroidia bacterium]